jgi:hypothetical protein
MWHDRHEACSPCIWLPLHFILECRSKLLSAKRLQVTFYSTQSVGTPPAPTGTPPSPALQLLDPDEAAQTLATQAATNNTALFVTSPELVSNYSC